MMQQTEFNAGPAPDYAAQIEQWLVQPPSLVASGFGRRIAPALNPVLRVTQAVIPESLFEQALVTASRASTRVALRQRVMQQAGVTNIESLRSRPIPDCDQQWRSLRRSAMGLAGGTGAASGVAGAAGLTLDIPALILQSYVGIHRTGMCYGYDCSEANAPGFALAIFALANANTLEEKQAAWQALVGLHDLQNEALRDGLEAAIARQLGKGSVATGMQRLATQLGMNLGRRKAAAVVPILGALIGGSINAWVMADLMQVARYAFIARRLGLLPEPPTCPETV